MITVLLRRQIRRFAIAVLFFISLIATSSGLIGESTSVALLQKSSAAYAQAPSVQFITEGVQSAVLDNGLTILMKPTLPTSGTIPAISINVVYGVGFTDEGEGETGAAHVLEHMLLKGTKNRPVHFGRLLRALGSEPNAMVKDEHTDYFHTFVGRDKISAILTLEADRVLNSRIAAEELATEKEVVKAETKANRIVTPNSLFLKSLFQAAYPGEAGKHYSLATEADIEALSQAQVEAFYKKYYSPSNATIVIVGDFDVDDTLSTIKALFGPLSNPTTATSKSNGLVKPAEAVPMAAQTEPFILQLPDAPRQVRALFPLPNATHPDAPALELMMIQPIVNSVVHSSHSQQRESGWYSMRVDVEPEQSLEAAHEVLQQTLSQLKEQLIKPAELAQIKGYYEATQMSATATIDLEAEYLGRMQLLAGDYLAINDYLAAIEAVTPEDVRRVAQKYLSLDQAIVGFLEPTVDESKPPLLPPSVGTTPIFEGSATVVPVDLPDITEYMPPLIGEAAKLDQALPEKVVLENSLQVLLVPNSNDQAITVRGWVDAGDRFDPEGKAGTALLTARSLVSGTDSEEAISLTVDTGLDGVELSAEIQVENLTTGIEAIANYLQSPVFSDNQFAEQQQQLKTEVVAELTNPEKKNLRILRQAMYPERHPMRQFATDESVSAISPTDLQAFYNQHYHPDNTIIALVGKFDSAQVKLQLAQVFRDWQARGEAPILTLPPVPMPESSHYIAEPLTVGTVAMTVMGHSTIPRNDPRYYALMVVNEVLGGHTLSGRLGLNIRDRQGLLYRAQSILYEGRDVSELTIDMSTPVENVDRAIASAIAVLKQLKSEGITTSELQSAKQWLVSSYFLDLSYPDLVAEHALDAAVNQLDEDELRTYPEKIWAVTLEDVRAVLEELIGPNKLVIVTTAEPNTQ